MKTEMLKRARAHFSSPWVPAHVNRANQLKWIRSVRFLGDRWLLAQPVQRREAA